MAESGNGCCPGPIDSGSDFESAKLWKEYHYKHTAQHEPENGHSETTQPLEWVGHSVKLPRHPGDGFQSDTTDLFVK